MGLGGFGSVWIDLGGFWSVWVGSGLVDSHKDKEYYKLISDIFIFTNNKAT